MRKHQGYNTPSSRKSQGHWNYAQSIVRNIFLKYGKMLLVFILILIVLFFFMNINLDVSVYLGTTLGVVFVIVSFYKVEKRLK